MSYDWISYLATALVLAAVYLISIPKLSGQYLILLADLTWFGYSLLTDQYGLALQSVVLMYISSRAIRNWRAKGVG